MLDLNGTALLIAQLLELRDTLFNDEQVLLKSELASNRFAGQLLRSVLQAEFQISHGFRQLSVQSRLIVSKSVQHAAASGQLPCF